jgi:protein SCO1/2
MNWCTILIGAMLAFGPLFASAPATAGDSRWGRGYLPNTPVVTQDNKSLFFYDDVLKGKIVILSFIYTTCRDICPVVTARLSQLEEKLGDVVGRDIFFVSVSIDPDNDTPEKLKEYANAFSAGPSWLFLTGKPADMEAMRYKLGERRERISQHRNEILLYNDATGDWERSSVFGDLNTLAVTVRAMDPAWRNRKGSSDAVKPSVAGLEQGKSAASGTGAVASIGLPGEALFIKTCASCHTIGRGDKVGPDLLNLTTRRDRSWIASFIADPEKMLSQDSPAVRELTAKYRAVRMPNLGLADVDISDVIAYIEAKTYAVEADRKNPEMHHHHVHNH